MIAIARFKQNPWLGQLNSQASTHILLGFHVLPNQPRLVLHPLDVWVSCEYPTKTSSTNLRAHLCWQTNVIALQEIACGLVAMKSVCQLLLQLLLLLLQLHLHLHLLLLFFFFFFFLFKALSRLFLRSWSFGHGHTLPLGLLMRFLCLPILAQLIPKWIFTL